MKKIGIIRGGNLKYKKSLDRGSHILRHLFPSKKYKTVDILIDKNGIWHLNGLPADFEKIFHIIDIAFNTTFDKEINHILNHWKVPSVGSGPFDSAICNHKVMVREKLHNLGFKIPKHIVFPVYQEDFDGDQNDYPIRRAKEVWGKLPPPLIVKPLSSHSNMAIHICKSFPELVHAFEDGLNHNVSVIVEEFIEGKQARVQVVEGFRGQDLYSFPVNGIFSLEEKKNLEELACLVHNGFDLDHCSQSNFVVKNNNVYVLSVKTFPDLEEDFSGNVGSNHLEFLEHLVDQVT
ncbi:MAG: hypothetical protein U9R00_01445 [Patescibacteria group bacterium]|nr:hypothetical protein [Patescibacteria group bacterium]